MKIKTIDVNAKEWFDEVNGNSYFSGSVTVNYGMKTAKTYEMPFQYGYGDHYKDIALKTLVDNRVLFDLVDHYHLWQLRDAGITVRTFKQENCRKRDLM